jgi:hypothetical protein
MASKNNPSFGEIMELWIGVTLMVAVERERETKKIKTLTGSKLIVNFLSLVVWLTSSQRKPNRP